MFVDDDLPMERLEHEITSMAGQLAATTCRWLQLVAAFDRREGWQTWGMRSCAHWLSWRCGLSLRSGREHVQVGHGLARLPLTTAAFERGELSYSKVRALVRVADPSSEAELLDFARTATASQLDRTVRAYEVSNRPPAVQREERSVESWLDGSLRAQLAPEALAVVTAAIEAALAHVPVDEGAAAPSIEQRRADALVLLAESFLAHGAETRPGGERTMVVLHVDADGQRGPELDNGTPLHPQTARRLGCDTSAVAVIERDGAPIGIGRRARTVPRSVRRAVTARDRHCRWPGCTSRMFTEAHHRQHWTDGGSTDLENLVLLCWFHHHLLHEGGYRIDEQHRVFRPDGVQVVAPPPAPAEPLEVTVSPTAIEARWAGERLDLDLAVTALHCLAGTAYD